jgi:hypothetical protein
LSGLSQLGCLLEFDRVKKSVILRCFHIFRKLRNRRHVQKLGPLVIYDQGTGA